ncbi:hypothetical protein TNCV_4977501 [Trichonephila clavipes]|nr:hypothetical protein TNCV_4977501 [Trichonephila clavipes]
MNINYRPSVIVVSDADCGAVGSGFECLYRLKLHDSLLSGTSFHLDVKDDHQYYSDIEYSAEKRLVDKLMRGYDNSVRPVKNASHAIVIRLGITLTQIFDLIVSASDTTSKIGEIYGEYAMRRHHAAKWRLSFQSGKQNMENRNMAGSCRPSSLTTVTPQMGRFGTKLLFPVSEVEGALIRHTDFRQCCEYIHGLMGRDLISTKMG